MNQEEAKQMALNYLNKNYNVEGDELMIVDASTIETSSAWVFFYNSREYLKNKNLGYMLAGNSPMIVSKRDGNLYETGTAQPIEYYLEQFEKGALIKVGSGI